MPQMAPISWLLLFFIFSSTLVLFTIINYYYLTLESPSSSQMTITQPTLTWKW
uniref:ATP synthase complex subunit 8 n=1 Tax=Ocellarnaca fuscotessellata TaxID=3003723 RepID=A0A9E9IZF2_9ORTH|nr:ATP synthase F0 subunit 8 [Ocellarnaca fuscotessellata]WAM61679.1 ATP synthase F0 subunit 8 [Ocellarnaca fuscotessellata]